MLAWIILLCIVTVFAVRGYLKSGAFMQPINPVGIISALKGAIRGVWLFIQAHAWYALLWYALLLFSYTITMPPYIFDLGIFIVIPLATYLKLHGLPIALAFGTAYTIVFLSACTVIAIHFLFMRKILK